MIGFWIVCFLMLGLALVFLLPAFYRTGNHADVDRNSLNINIARQRLRELQADADAGFIAQSDLAIAREELERNLLDDLDQSVRPGTTRFNPLWPISVAVGLPLIVSGLYLQVGTPQALLEPATAVVETSTATAVNSDSQLEPLKARVNRDDKDVEAWLLLAQAYMAMKQYGDAADTLETLRAKNGDNPLRLARNANALAMANRGQIQAKSLGLVEAALALDPNQPQGLWLAGMAAFQRSDYQAALDYWRRLEPLMPHQDEDAMAGLKEVIQRAESELAKPSSGVAGQPAIDGSMPLLRVSVTLDERFIDQASPDDTLFVYARAMQDPQIPLAVVRKRVEDLPLTVILDDSMAMLPEMRLSNFKEVRVSARISKSGDAIPQSGDFLGEVAPVHPADAQLIRVIISTLVP